ncbi:MAG: hypothetical protein V3S29_08765 [bacterium]
MKSLFAAFGVVFLLLLPSPVAAQQEPAEEGEATPPGQRQPAETPGEATSAQQEPAEEGEATPPGQQQPAAAQQAEPFGQQQPAASQPFPPAGQAAQGVAPGQAAAPSPPRFSPAQPTPSQGASGRAPAFTPRGATPSQGGSGRAPAFTPRGAGPGQGAPGGAPRFSPSGRSSARPSPFSRRQGARGQAATGQGAPATLDACRLIPDSQGRLDCYDRLQPRPPAAPPAPPPFTRTKLVTRSCIGNSRCLENGLKLVEERCSIQQAIHAMVGYRTGSMRAQILHLALRAVPDLPDEEVLVGQVKGVEAAIFKTALPEIANGCASLAGWDRFDCQRKQLASYVPQPSMREAACVKKTQPGAGG